MSLIFTVTIADALMVVTANLVNLLMAGIFLTRPVGKKRAEHSLGIVAMLLALPAAAVAVWNASAGRAWWLVWLPVPYVMFSAAEWLLDYRLKLNFRHSRWLAPYLIVYYFALIALTGYGFSVGLQAGLLTLATYFVQLLAAWYSYSKVGHG